MKKFQFKLEAPLKLRTFKEKMIEAEVGRILSKIHDNQDQIEKLKEDIEIAYKSQEKILEQQVSVNSIKFYPQYLNAKKLHIQKIEEEIIVLKKQYEQKLTEMRKARGDVKIFEKLKEKSIDEYKKEVSKEEQENIEEMVLLRTGRDLTG